MAYTPKTWADGELVAAADLNRVENGVRDAHSLAEQPRSQISNAQGSQVIDASGGVQHSVGGTRVWWVNHEGTLRAGAVPADLVTGLGTLLYDSGQRRLSTLATGLTSGDIFLRIKYGWATMVYQNAVFATASPTPFTGGVLGGIAPSGTIPGKGMVVDSTNGVAYRTDIGAGGTVAIGGLPASRAINGSIVWAFDREIPATPLGSPA